LNLLGNQQPAAGTSATNPPQLIPGPGGPMPPPFFFPSLPFMAPYTIPPPPMPQNLDQLTIEELRAMEGNERKHVEERLKLLRNVQTMLNASAALMSQYQMVVASLPPIPVPPVAATSSATTATQPSSSSSSAPPVVESSQVKLEDVGSEENVVDSTSVATASTSKFTTLESASSSFIANESLASSSTSDEANGDSEEANEIRKRRLQKFTQSD
jgi:E3 ubiquitin-protein ligase synoviolin